MNVCFGIVTDENCFLRSRPGSEAGREKNDSGIEDEIFSGWAVRIFPETEENGWVKIETHYGYTGYVCAAQLARIDRRELIRRQDSSRFFRIGVPLADLLDQPKVQGLPLERLLKNAIVELLPDEDADFAGEDAAAAESMSGSGWCKIRTAAGRTGYLHENYLRERRDDDGYLLQECGRENAAYFREHCTVKAQEEKSFREGLVKSARSYLGVQYRWGGKSSLGLDCSGLVFMSYLENGVLIYRDAKLQEAYPVSEISREQLQPGDLLYFPGHVAMYLGAERYIHSTARKETPYVTVNSLNPADADYREDLACQITACGSIFPFCKDTEDAAYIQPGYCMRRETRSARAVWQDVCRRLEAMPGNVSAVYRNLDTGESFAWRPDEPHIAASVIKMFLMAAVFQGFADGVYSPEDRIVVHREDCVPSCGVLTYLQGEPAVSIRDLVELMIIVSDNTAANVLFDLVGEEPLSLFLREQLGLKQTVFQRKMFDAKRAAQGIENYVTAAEAAWFLESVCRGELISPEASAEMYQILTHQRLNGKIPFYLHTLKDAPVIAHKTGEDTGTTHDVAIIMPARAGTGNPFVLCFLGNDTDVPSYERMMAEAALELYEASQVTLQDTP